MSTKTAAFLALCLLIFSCTQEFAAYNETADFSITSPKAGWNYFEDAKIMFSVDVNTEDIRWMSSLSGFLGAGNHLTLFLPDGLHRVSAEIRGQRKEQNVYVSPNIGGTRTILVNYSPLEIKAKGGNCSSYLYSHDGSVNNFSISSIHSVTAYSQEFINKEILYKPARDIRFPMPNAGKRIDRIRRRSITGISYNIGDKRSFFVTNTVNQTGPPHQITAVLTYQSGALSVWLSESAALSGNGLDDCIRTVETLVIPRVEALWGKTADIDGNGRIALLFSPTINDEQAAFGFFNPADFFERNEDILSDAYNPSSNEIAVIYAALPESGPDSPYSATAIIATIAHEMAHAATFTAKTWGRIQNGNKQAQREELFLDEGWSHLTENLCGLGISGGNIEFTKRFFNDTSMYSFCGANRAGQDDSAGMRGAITLFLSWLFWEAGGMSWNSANPIMLIDRGGISFLKRMIESPDTGWESIGKAFGRPTRQLFNEFLEEMHKYRLQNSAYNYKTDPFTGEAVDFFVNMGGATGLGFPKSSSAFTTTSLTPWSFVFMEDFNMPDDSLLMLDSGNLTENIFFSFSVRK
ncbi:MAG: hypothetical protein LBG95_08555 [Treponema sp.]|jgi:hypothetical protein|nr:hypothetical protein [Treponema sp.]